MSRKRSFILLSSSFLLASSAWADDLGYVDCVAHPENTQVFAKPRQTPDSVATVACGERFTILLNGFIFSRVQTKDGKVGYVYSSVITPDHTGSAPGQAAASRAPAVAVAAAPASNPHPAVANAATAAPAYAQPASSAQAASMPVTTSLPAQKPAASTGPLFPTPPVPAVTAADVNYSSPAQATPAASSAPAPTASANVQAAPAAPQPAAPTSAPPVTPSAPAAASVTPAAPAPAPAASAQPAAPAPAPATAEPQPSTSSTTAQSSAPAQPGPLFPTPPAPAAPASTTPDPAPAPAPPAAEPAPASQPQPEAAQPAPEPVRSVKARESWERPMAGVHQSFLLELYGGYGFARFNSGGVSTNLNGGMGSFGYNFKSWLQLGGDASYNYVTINGVKNILYGNHFGVRYFYHRFSRFTPWAEGLVGGSRVDTSGGGVKTSTNCISYKVGGGVDYRASRRWEIRIINVDYYRTSFGSGTGYPGQNNYWASAGVVMRLFGSGASE